MTDCKARRSASDPPQDCDWPLCGCDPQANKVIEALQESGHLADAPQEVTPEAETPIVGPLRRVLESYGIASLSREYQGLESRLVKWAADACRMTYIAHDYGHGWLAGRESKAGAPQETRVCMCASIV